LKWKAAEKPKAEGASVEKDKKESAEPETVEELLITAHQATRKKDWEAARGALEKLVERAPQVRDPEGAYPMLARVYRQLGLEAEETAVLEKAIAVLTDLPGGHERLLDLYEKQQAWTQVERICGLGLGIMPMSLRMIEASIRAAEMTGHTQAAISACNKALLLDPNRAARWHSRLGRLLAPQAPDAARVHLLEALESNPRDHAALEVLAAIHPKDSTPPPTETGPESIPPQSKPENPKR
jgi:tetratricopeptide (TPR) repeat protein